MGRYIPDEIIDEIAARADIVDVVQSYVPGLQHAGQRWKACCPFHQEKTPSFIINPASNTFHCFGCGKGGNVFKFVMMIENLQFPDAAQMLARKYNVIIPEPERRHYTREDKEAGVAAYNLRERVFLLHEKLAAWYRANLGNGNAAKAAEYFKTRRLDPVFAEKFMIGAAPDLWDGMIQWATREGFTIDEMKEGRLVSESKKTPGKFFDFFRNRLIFPIWNEQGRVVGFSARQIDPEQGGGKYVNSSESVIFKKSRILYGLNFARPEIAKKGFAIICEGQMDVIAMHSAGCGNAVAAQGTAFGSDQAMILHRYTENITLALDSDSAGVNAILKDAAILLPLGFNLKVARFPGGKDPDELLKNSGAEAVQKAVGEAVDFFEFLFMKETEGQDIALPAVKTKVAENLLKFIMLFENAVARDSYLQWLAGKLGLSTEAMLSEVRRLSAKEVHQNRFRREVRERREEIPPAAPPPGKIPESVSNPLLQRALTELLEVILADSESADLVKGELPEEMLDSGPYAVAVETVIQARMNDEWEDAPAMITQRLVECEFDYAGLTAVLSAEPRKHSRSYCLKTVRDCLKRIKILYFEKQLKHIKTAFVSMPPGPDRNELLRKSVELTRSLNALNHPRIQEKPKPAKRYLLPDEQRPPEEIVIEESTETEIEIG